MTPAITNETREVGSGTEAADSPLASDDLRRMNA